MRATKVFEVDRIIILATGGLCRLRMDLFDVGKDRCKGLFLDRFRFSWIFFEVDNPMRRVLVDCHEPFGIHLHFDDGLQEAVTAETLDEAREVFAAAIKKHFGAEVEA